MKTMKYTAVAALGILALASCNKEGHVADSSRFITVEAQIGDMTKATYNGNKSAFAAGDDLSLFAWTGSKTAIPADLVVDGVVNTLGTDGKTWTPKTQMLWADVDIPHYFMAVSPAREVKSFTADPFTLEPAAAKYQQSDLLIAVNDKGLTAENNPVQLTFDHAMAKLNVNLTFRDQWTEAKVDTLMVEAKKSATIDYIKKAVTATGEAATVGMNRVSDASWTTLMVPQTGFRSISINVSGNGTYQFNATEDIPLQSGKVTTVNLIVGRDQIILDKAGVTITDWAAGTVINNGEAQIATDLSMVDCAGNARAEGKAWTANCYMVHTKGFYKLPLVYGNAIKNGAVNEIAYKPGSQTTTNPYTDNFVNHAGNAITAPWITKSASGEGVNKGMGITVNSAALLWQDAEGLITKVGIDGDYLTLTVGKDATTQEGNAVVAAKDGSGTIVWSWHIWVTKETFATLTTVATGSHDYQVTPVNLGWVPTGGEGKQGYNTFYQWGRKDAFIPGTGTANTNHTVYDISGTAVTGITYTASTEATIADNIKNPTTHYYNSSNNGPCNTTYYNMWDAQNTVNGNVTSATKKTVYDPSPAGFCVPTGNLFYFMGNGSSSRPMTTSWDYTNKGATWDNSVVASSISGEALWFPASGYRYYSSGTLSTVGGYGYYWSASPYGTDSGRNLYFGSGYWSWGSSVRAYGFPVRPVAEE